MMLAVVLGTAWAHHPGAATEESWVSLGPLILVLAVLAVWIVSTFFKR